MAELFEQLDFHENPLFERIIEDLLTQQYCVVDTFFDRNEVAALRLSLQEKLEEETFKKAAIGNKTNETIAKSIRGDFIRWIDEHKANVAEMIFFKRINNLIDYLNKTCFLGIRNKEFHYAMYPKGTFYKRHLDTFQNDDRRKLSFVLYLNDDQWSIDYGGELVIYQQNKYGETQIKINPVPGRVVIFESQVLEHEVKPVLKDARYSITGWMKTS
jgi:SM-20-related protein